MGLLSAIFGGRPLSARIGKSVEAVERLTRKHQGSPIDERRAPLPIGEFKRLLLEEIQQASATSGNLRQARRYANCYVALSCFQPDVDLLAPRPAARSMSAAMHNVHDVLVKIDRESLRAELERAGYGHLL